MVRALQAFYKHDSPQMIQHADTMGSKRSQGADRGPRVSWFNSPYVGSCLLCLLCDETLGT